MISVGLEWFYRLIREPRRMWRRYLIGNILFVLAILKEKFLQNYKVSQTVSVRPDAIKGEQA